MRRLATAVLAAALAGGGASAQSLYVVCDNGLRCVAAPCPSTSALDASTRETFAGVYADPTRLTPEDRQKVDDAQALYSGSLVFEGSAERRQLDVRGRRVPALYIVLTRIERRARPAEMRACRAARRDGALR